MTPASDDSRFSNALPSEELDLETFTHTAPILLSDNEPQIVRLYEILMARLRLRTVSIPDSRQALDYMLNKPVSLVISDLLKRHLTGLDMLKALRQDTTTSDMPFMIVTATPDYESRLIFNALRGSAYLAKPINNKHFTDVVVHLLSEQLANEAA